MQSFEIIENLQLAATVDSATNSKKGPGTPRIFLPEYSPSHHPDTEELVWHRPFRIDDTKPTTLEDKGEGDIMYYYALLFDRKQQITRGHTVEDFR